MKIKKLLIIPTIILSVFGMTIVWHTILDNSDLANIMCFVTGGLLGIIGVLWWENWD